MYTLNSTEIHAVCYATQACGDRDNASQSFSKELSYTVPANPMSDRGQAVIILSDCVGVDCYNGTLTGGHQ